MADKPAVDPRFLASERKYQELRHLRETKLLTEESFVAELKKLGLRDETGRFWMIGAMTGEWYAYDGEQWVKSRPPLAPSLPTAPVTLPPRSGEFNLRQGVPSGNNGVGRLLLLVVGGLFIGILAALVTLSFARGNDGGATTLASSSPVKSPATASVTAAAMLGTQEVLTPSLTPVSLGLTSSVSPSVTSTGAAPTQAPSITSTATAVPETPPPSLASTELPAPPTVAPARSPVVTSTPFPSLAPPTPTQNSRPAPATLAPTAPPPTTIPEAPAVTVQQIRLDPATPAPKQQFGFLVTFQNTFQTAQAFRWIVLIYKRDENGVLKQTGQTAHIKQAVIPIGKTELRSEDYPFVSGGERVCQVSRVMLVNEDDTRTPLPGPGQDATFCLGG